MKTLEKHKLCRSANVVFICNNVIWSRTTAEIIWHSVQHIHVNQAPTNVSTLASGVLFTRLKTVTQPCSC